jgi:hypothetical protein
MAAELKATNPAVNIEILGVNRNDESAYNYLMTLGRSLPWLQDTTDNSVWSLLGVTYRDVRILDPQNHLFAVFNLTTYDLYYETNRATLKKLFLAAARFIDTDGDKLSDDWEVLNFGNLLTGPTDDPDGDGQNNFTEYAFGTDPNDANSKSSFQPTVTGSGPDQSFTLTFRRRAGSALSYLFESSPEFEPWSPSAGDVMLTQPFLNLFDGTGTGRTQCTLTTPVQAHSREFLRVRAVPSPP